MSAEQRLSSTDQLQPLVEPSRYAAGLTGSLILLDLAARLVPIPVAATVFAVIMALATLGASFGEALGGVLYDLALEQYGAGAAYRLVLVLGTAMIASCWLWVPRLKRQLAIHAID